MSHSVLALNDSRGVILSWDGTTPGESFCPGMERLQGSHSVLGWNDSRESFCPRMERLQGSHSVSGMERFQGSHSIQRTEGLQGSNSVLGWKNSLGLILSWDRTTLGDWMRIVAA